MVLKGNVARTGLSIIFGASLLAIATSGAHAQTAPAAAPPPPAQTDSQPPAASPAPSLDVDQGQTQATAGGSGQAVGQASTEAADVKDIVVTARRREERLQTVPVTVSVITPDQMARTQIYDQFSLQSQVPGFFNSTRSPGNGNITSFNRIRGVPGVAYYFDEVPLTNRQATFYAQYFDVRSIQTLEGPQGTLFGQASNAGALIFDPVTPGNELSGYGMAELGNYKKKNFEAALDIPLIDDKLALRVSGKSSYRDGYVTNVTNGSRQGIENYDIFRATLVARPFEGVSNTTMFQVQHVSQYGQPARTIDAINLTPSSPLLAFLPALNGQTAAQYRAAADYVLAQQLQLGINRFANTSTGCPASDGSAGQTSTVPGPNIANVAEQACAPGRSRQTDYDLVNKTIVALGGGWQIKNVFGYNTYDEKPGTYDVDTTALILLESNPKNVTNRPKESAWTEELQVSGSPIQGLDVIGGGFFLDDHFKNPRLYGAYVINLADALTKVQRHVESKALYGQADAHLTSKLTVTGGVRYTWDSTIQTLSVLDPTTFQIVSSTGGKNTASGDAKFGTLDYNTSVKYQFTPATMVYATHSRGHTAGGLQNLPGFERYDPDVLKNYELGLKTNFTAGPARLTLNTAGYYGDYSNVQVTNAIVTNGGANVLVGIFNAAKARIYGGEVQLSGNIGESFTFHSFVNYASAEYTRYPSIDPVTHTPVDLSKTPFPSNPHWKFGISPAFYLPVNRERIGSISLGANYTWNSFFWGSVSQPRASKSNPTGGGAICKLQRTAANGFGPLSADGGYSYIDCAPKHDDLDLSLIWNDVLAHKGLQLGVRVTNVLDNKRPTGTAGLWAAVGFNTVDVPLPRMASVWIKETF